MSRKIIFYFFVCRAGFCMPCIPQIIEGPPFVFQPLTRGIYALVRDFLPSLGDWRQEFALARLYKSDDIFQNYVLDRLVNPYEESLRRASLFERSVVDYIDHLCEVYGTENVKRNLLVSLFSLPETERLADVLRLKTILGSDPKELPGFGKAIENLFEIEKGRGRVARSKIFGTDGLERIPDNQIHPLRGEDHRVMGFPSQLDPRERTRSTSQ
jgi:hypothetical protein